MTSISGFGGSVASIGNNATSLPTAFTFSNGLISFIAYNSHNLTTSIAAGSAMNVGYGYDSRGTTTSCTNNLDPGINWLKPPGRWAWRPLFPLHA